MTFDQTRRTDRNELVAVLNSIATATGKPRVRGNSVLCPFHPDKDPSAGIYPRSDGAYAFHCMPCEIDEDVYGVEERLAGPREAMKPVSAPAPLPSYSSIAAAAEKLTGLVDTYRYISATGETDFVVFRLEPKSFRQLSKGLTGWQFTAAHVGKLPLFNRMSIAAKPDEPVLFVEGEKSVKYLHNLGILATTAPGGAKSTDKADYSPLAGRRVNIWPDNDEAGREHARAVKRHLEELDPPAVATLIDVASLGLPEKSGADDYAAQNPGTNADKRDDILAVCKEMKDEESAASLLKGYAADIRSGKLKSVSIPFAKLDQLTNAFVPGKILLIVGGPGVSKSLFSLQLITEWVTRGTKACILMLEDEMRDHTNRVLAQMTGESNVTQIKWVEKNTGQYENLVDSVAASLDRVKKRIWAPDSIYTFKDVTDWIITRAQAGNRVIWVDPITAAEEGKKDVWTVHQRFINETKLIAREYNCTVVVTSHLRQPGARIPIEDNVAGGRAWMRFCHSVWHMGAFKTKEVRLLDGGTVEANRWINISKARNGIGTGMKDAMMFDGRYLTFVERGAMDDDERKKK